MMAFNNPYAPVITQVSVPFSSPIPGGVINKKQIQIQGIVQDILGANRFSINLCEGKQVTPSCALHFNPRFDENCIVRNAMKGGQWGLEERDGGLPIMKGQLFEIIIMTAPSGYFVAVNGRHFTEFKHRMPMASVKYLVIEGDFLMVNFIKYEEGSMPVTAPGPGFSPGVAPPPYTPGGFAAPGMGAAWNAGMQPSKDVGLGNNTLHNPPIPLTKKIPGIMYPNQMIYISAIPNPDAKRFTFNLQSGPAGNVNFHFDVRIDHLGEHNVVVRNTLVNGQWGREERNAQCFPFSRNAPFDMIIFAEATTFKVAVNNTHFISYAHRQPLEKSDTLKVTGDVRITSLHFQ